MIRDSSTIEICMCVCEYFHVVVVQVTAQSAYLMFSKCKKQQQQPNKTQKVAEQAVLGR